MWGRLWCAGKLCPHPELRRFHITCLICRWRRKYYGNWIEPPYWITYDYKHNLKPATFHGHRAIAFTRLIIDPRGNFTPLRCAIIVTVDNLLCRVPRLIRPLVEFCEFLSCCPTWDLRMKWKRLLCKLGRHQRPLRQIYPTLETVNPGDVKVVACMRCSKYWVHQT